MYKQGRDRKACDLKRGGQSAVIIWRSGLAAPTDIQSVTAAPSELQWLSGSDAVGDWEDWLKAEFKINNKPLDVYQWRRTKEPLDDSERGRAKKLA